MKYVDTREHQDVKELFNKSGYKTKMLTVGDIVDDGVSVCIELKDHDDLQASMYDGRLPVQCGNMRSGYNHNYLIVYPAKNKFIPDRRVYGYTPLGPLYVPPKLYGSQISMVSAKFKIPVHKEFTLLDVVELCNNLVRDSGADAVIHERVKLIKKVETEVKMLCQIDKLGLKRSIEVHSKFGTVGSVVNATPQEIVERCDGVGMTLANRIKEVYK